MHAFAGGGLGARRAKRSKVQPDKGQQYAEVLASKRDGTSTRTPLKPMNHQGRAIGGQCSETTRGRAQGTDSTVSRLKPCALWLPTRRAIVEVRTAIAQANLAPMKTSATLILILLLAPTRRTAVTITRRTLMSTYKRTRRAVFCTPSAAVGEKSPKREQVTQAYQS